MLGRYCVEGELGRGSMGVVYLARDPDLRRLVAVKTVSMPHGLPEEDKARFLERFKREARAAGALSHPGIVTIYSIEEIDEPDLPIIAMEYVPGMNLEQALRREGAMDAETVLEMGDVLADALQTAHRAGVIHRDIKPANILVRDDGAVKIADFGVARLVAAELTREGALCGSPAYMAPEQILKGAASSRSDIYSLGVILYELLSGQRLFRGDNIGAITHAIVNDAPSPIRSFCPQLPESADRFFARALAKNPEDRFPDGGSFRRGLDEIRLDLELDKVVPEAESDSASIEGGATIDVAVTWVRERPWVLHLVILAWVAAMGIWGVRLLTASDETQAASSIEESLVAKGPPVSTGDTVGLASPPAETPEPTPEKVTSQPHEPVQGASEERPDVQPARPVETAPPPPRQAPVEKIVTVQAPAVEETTPEPDAAIEPAERLIEDPAPSAGPKTGEHDPGAAVGPSQRPVQSYGSVATPGALSAEPAYIRLSVRSSVKSGTLRLFVDGEEIYSHQLTNQEATFKRLLKRAVKKGVEEFEARIPVAPGSYEVVARLEVDGKSREYGASVDLELAAGETREIKLVAGRTFGSPLALKLP